VLLSIASGHVGLLVRVRKERCDGYRDRADRRFGCVNARERQMVGRGRRRARLTVMPVSRYLYRPARAASQTTAPEGGI
jgi:hypothetical protein